MTGGDLGNGYITKRLAEGHPLGSWWLYEKIGIWQTEEQIANNPHTGFASPGRFRFKDQNGDGVINGADKVYFGSYVPKLSYGINIGLNYKQFDFNLNAIGVGGNKVYNALRSNHRGGNNIPAAVFKHRWTGPYSTYIYPAAYKYYRPSSFYLESGAFLRINNITLGYTIPNMTGHIKNIRLYISAENPFVFTDYSGFTPELIGNGLPYGTAGMELNAYPTTRTFLFGINIDFQ